MAIKLDMSKAYNKVEWNFLDSIMLKLGFNEQWTKLVMHCITSTTYSVFFNWEPQAPFKLSRGIRQGEPISPYLFIIVAKALSHLLYQAKIKGFLTSVPIGRGLVLINYLFFVDDNLLFCKANSIKWSKLLSLLDLYENASGQALNKDKTFLFFSNNTPNDVKQTITAIAGVKPLDHLRNI